MRLGVVSDTDGDVPYTMAAVALLRDEHPDIVIHCGDIGTAAIIPLFAEWPTHFVFGNVDNPAELERAIQQAGQTCHDEFGTLLLDHLRIAWLHSHDARLFQQTITSGKWDLVCYGHTHQRESHLQGTTLVLNPGALYRASPRTFAVVDLPELTIRHISVPSS